MCKICSTSTLVILTAWKEITLNWLKASSNRDVLQLTAIIVISEISDKSSNSKSLSSTFKCSVLLSGKHLITLACLRLMSKVSVKKMRLKTQLRCTRLTLVFLVPISLLLSLPFTLLAKKEMLLFQMTKQLSDGLST